MPGSAVSAAATRRQLMALGLATGGAGLLAGAASAQGRKAGAGRAIDALARQALAAWPDQPGLGIAVVEDGAVTLARGYGVRRMGPAEPCDARTLFGIASNTKAFTSAALALLVEEGKVAWDAPVTRYLPDFAMSDPVVTRLMTVRDLLVHRSGLALGAGDLMSWPPGIRTTKEIVAGLRHLPIANGFRAGYAYDNVLYIVAGELIAAVSGMPWQRFVDARLLKPIGMTDSRAQLEGSRQVAAGHAARPARAADPRHGADAGAAAGGQLRAGLRLGRDRRLSPGHREVAADPARAGPGAFRQADLERGVGEGDVDAADHHLLQRGADARTSRCARRWPPMRSAGTSPTIAASG